jgi:hypothetical protein
VSSPPCPLKITTGQGSMWITRKRLFWLTAISAKGGFLRSGRMKILDFVVENDAGYFDVLNLSVTVLE